MRTLIPYYFWAILAFLALMTYNFGANGLIAAVVIAALLS